MAPVKTKTAYTKTQQAESLPGSRVPLLARLLRSLIWMVFAFAALTATLEGVFYLAQTGEEEFLKLEPLVGFGHFEKKRVTFRSEGYSSDQTNSCGFRDSEHALAKAPGVMRIALLGDSKTEALQVGLDETFGKVLERRLNRSGGRRFEVLNFGMSAYSTAQEYLLFLSKVASYHPDVTILVYNVFDSDENVLAAGDGGEVPRPYFAVDGQGKLSIDWTPMRRWMMSERARLYRLLDGLRRESRIWGVLTKLEPQVRADRSAAPLLAWAGKLFAPAWSALVRRLPAMSCPTPCLSELDPAPPSPVPVVAVAPPAKPGTPADVALFAAMLNAHSANWPVTSVLIKRLNDACKRNHSSFVLVSLPAPNNQMLYFKELISLRAQAKAQGFPFVDINETFPSLPPMARSPLYLSKWHFSSKGHQKVADQLFPVISGLCRTENIHF